jgi:glutathione S-transferase
MTQHPILYSFRRCPYAMRARMAIAYANCKVELREILLKDKPQQMLAASAKGTVPVLVIPNSLSIIDDKAVIDDKTTIEDITIIDESRDVMLWSLQQNDPQHWYYGLTEDKQKLIDSLIDMNDLEFKPLLDKYKYAVRFPQQSEQDYFDSALPILEQLDNRLKTRKFLISNTISLADIAIFPFIRQFAFVDKAKFDSLLLKHLNSWLESWLTSGLFSCIMKKYQPWQFRDDKLFFPES